MALLLRAGYGCGAMTDAEIEMRMLAMAAEMEASGMERPKLVVSNIRQVRDVARRLGFEAHCGWEGRR